MELKSHSSKEREFGLVWSQLGYASYTKWGPARNPLLPDNMGMVSHICHLRQELAMWRKEDSWGPRASQPNLIRATGLRERLCLRKQSDTVAPKAVFCPPPTHTHGEMGEREKEEEEEKKMMMRRMRRMRMRMMKTFILTAFCLLPSWDFSIIQTLSVLTKI